MSNKATYQKRWFDQEDFVPEHDEMMMWVIDNIGEEISKRIPTFRGEKLLCHCLLEEPILDGYPPVYPDAILEILYNNSCEVKTEEYLRFIIEIKPKIDSYGSITRQISIYRKRMFDKYKQEPNILLVTNDNRFDKYFSNNGISVIHPSNPDFSDFEY